MDTDKSITPMEVADGAASNTSSGETLVFNVGGAIFETLRSTLMRVPASPLNNPDFLDGYYRTEKSDYFFDRDPDSFKAALGYFRTGQLYIPANLERDSMRKDLVFWGVPSEEIQPAGSDVAAQVEEIHHVNAAPCVPEIARVPETTSMKIWNILSNPASSTLAKLYAALTYFLMFVAIFIMVFETTSVFRYDPDYSVTQISNNSVSDIYFFEDDVNKDRQGRLHIVVPIIAIIIQVFFTVEYIIRLVAAPCKVRFIFSFLGVIDFLAFLPFFILFLLTEFSISHILSDILKFCAIFLVLRPLRILKHFKTPLKTEVFTLTIKESAGQLVFILSLFAIDVVASATVCYNLEASSVESYFRSIPDAFYWAVITLSTVGYGDMRPISVRGKIFTVFSALSGLVLIALLVTVLVHSYIECSRQVQSRAKTRTAAVLYTNVAECRPLARACPIGQNA